MPTKPIKRGIKMWCRADNTNGYLCDFDIYTGKTQQVVQHGLGYSVVTKLCETIKGHWYAIFCDNFDESGKRKERRCKVCFDSGVRKMTSYFCPDCNVGLCAAPCFRIYHQ